MKFKKDEILRYANWDNLVLVSVLYGWYMGEHEYYRVQNVNNGKIFTTSGSLLKRRGSGRTTRMFDKICETVEQANKNTVIYVTMHNYRTAHWATDRILSKLRNNSKIKSLEYVLGRIIVMLKGGISVNIKGYSLDYLPDLQYADCNKFSYFFFDDHYVTNNQTSAYFQYLEERSKINYRENLYELQCNELMEICNSINYNIYNSILNHELIQKDMNLKEIIIDAQDKISNVYQKLYKKSLNCIKK